MAKIICKNIKFSYLDKKGKILTDVFQDFNAEFLDQKVTVLLGASGSGKTTLLNILAGLKRNYQGEILFDNVSASSLSIRDKDLSYITQKPVLYPKMTVFENIAFPLKFTLLQQEEINKRVRDIAKSLRIEHLLTRRPKYISYGQQQRVCIAKALIKEPSVLLLDEPFTGVDPKIKEELIELLKKNIEKFKITTIYVTHDYLEAVKLGDVIYLLEDGTITFKGNSKELLESDNEYLKVLINESKIDGKEING